MIPKTPPVGAVRRPQGSQGADPHKLAHHSRVHHGVQLLKHVAHHQRQGKSNEQPCGRALCHAANSLCHKTTPFHILTDLPGKKVRRRQVPVSLLAAHAVWSQNILSCPKPHCNHYFSGWNIFFCFLQGSSHSRQTPAASAPLPCFSKKLRMASWHPSGSTPKLWA